MIEILPLDIENYLFTCKKKCVCNYYNSGETKDVIHILFEYNIYINLRDCLLPSEGNFEFRYFDRSQKLKYFPIDSGLSELCKCFPEKEMYIRTVY